MSRTIAVAASIAVLLAACDDKKPAETSEAPSATVSASAAPPPPEPVASVAPEAAAPEEATSTKEPNVVVKDPEAEPSKSVKVETGGTVTLYLPKWAGTTWTVTKSPKPLGKAKEETIPGFAGPGTPAAGFIWKLTDPSLKAGQTLEASLENKSTADKAAAPKTFKLKIELVAPKG